MALTPLIISPSPDRALSVASIGVAKAIGKVVGELAEHTYNVYGAFAEGADQLKDPPK